VGNFGLAALGSEELLPGILAHGGAAAPPAPLDPPMEGRLAVGKRPSTYQGEPEYPVARNLKHDQAHWNPEPSRLASRAEKHQSSQDLATQSTGHDTELPTICLANGHA
jgi:hypothetical protein